MGEKVTKKVRQGTIEIDIKESALVVNFEVEVCRVDEDKVVLEVMDRKSESRRIKIKHLSPDKDLSKMASEICEKASFIHPSRIKEVAGLLEQLRSATDENRKSSERDNKVAEAMMAASAMSIFKGVTKDEQRAVRKAMEDLRSQEDELPEAQLSDLEEYLDMLYQVAGPTAKANDECLKVQIRGTGMILQLCRNVMNLEKLIQDSTIMGALTRVLQEEFKKSVDLTFNILRVFLAFSNFMEMHGLMANHRIGMLTMKIVDYEVKRYDHREDERKAREEEYKAIIEEAKIAGDEQAAMHRVKRLRENAEVKQKLYTKKQEKMLFVAFYILMNLAEDIQVEKKMLNKGLLQYLESMLERDNGDLLILAVSFIKKLSIYSENKDAIGQTSILHRLSRFLPCSSQPVVQITLQLLFNLSFDAELRAQMLKAGYVSKLLSLLKTAPYRAKALKILYHLSAEDTGKELVAVDNGVQLIMGLVLNFPNPILARELAALAVNLSHSPQNVELMVKNKGLNHLMDRLDNDYTEKDQGLLKVVRNISYWTFEMQNICAERNEEYRFRGLWAPHFKLLIQLLVDCDDHDVIIEIIGILANMTVDDVPANTSWSRLLKEFNLISLCSKLLIPGMAQNDLLLEVIMFISAIAADAQACDLIANSNLIGLLYQTWKERGEDREIKLQSIRCFHRLLLRETSREEAMYATRIVVDIIDCLSHSNPAIRQAADDVTDVVLELDRKPSGDLGQLGIQIRKKRFEGYNKTWLSEFDLLNGGVGPIDYAAIGNYEDDLHDLDDFPLDAMGMRHLKNRERLALDMSDLGDFGYGEAALLRRSAEMNLHNNSVMDDDDYEDSGTHWR